MLLLVGNFLFVISDEGFEYSLPSIESTLKAASHVPSLWFQGAIDDAKHVSATNKQKQQKASSISNLSASNEQVKLTKIPLYLPIPFLLKSK